jgi:hypothetical protein
MVLWLIAILMAMGRDNLFLSESIQNGGAMEHKHTIMVK